MTDTTTDLIQRYAAEIQRIINTGTNADHTWVGLLSALVQEYAGDHVPTFTDLHAFLDLASFRDHLSVTVANGDDTLTARIEGSVLAADPAVCIDLLDGAPYVLRKERGIVWAPVRCATLSRDGQTIATYLEAQQTEASLRRGLADITAGRTVDLGSFAQPATDPPAASHDGHGHRDGGEATRPKLNAQTAPSIPTDLTVPQGETGHEDQYETDFNCWLDSLSPGQREQITRDTEAARDLIDRERYPEPCDCTEQAARAAIAAAEPHIRAKTLAPIRAALADHPRCDIHPDDDPIKCGWKRAVADIQAALDREEQP